MKKDNTHDQKELTGIMGWIDYRLPIFSFMAHFSVYKTPKNLSYMWNLGSIAGIALVIQIITGLVLSMHYTPHVDYAFDSVEKIMRNVNYGCLLDTCTPLALQCFLLQFICIYFAVYIMVLTKPQENYCGK